MTVSHEVQRSPALSSTEAEYVALSEAAKEAIYIRNLLKETELLSCEDARTTLFCDNQSAGKLVKNPVYHARSKHIDIRYQFVRHAYDQRAIDVEYIPTTEMPADVSTKSLSQPLHMKCLKALGMEDQRQSNERSELTLRGGVSPIGHLNLPRLTPL